MGCSNSNILRKFNPFSNFNSQINIKILAEPYEIRQEKFLELKKITELIMSESLLQLVSKLLTAKENIIKSNLERIWEKNLAKFEENKITQKMFENSFYILLGESLINKYFLIENKNIASYLNNFLSSKNSLSKSELETLTLALSDPSLELISHDCIMHVDLSFSGTESFKIEDLRILKNVVDKLRYDEANFPSALFLHVNFETLTNSELLLDFIEAITKNTKLSFFAIVLNPLAVSKENNKKYLYSMNPFMYRSLFKVFEAVKSNKSIRHLVFTSSIESKIILAPEISNLILRKIAEDNLYGFYLGKILLTESFLKEVFSALANLNKLKYFCLDISGFNNRLSAHLNSVIARNRSLEIIGFLGFKYNEDNLKSFKNELKRNFNLKLVLNKERIEFS